MRTQRYPCILGLFLSFLALGQCSGEREEKGTKAPPAVSAGLESRLERLPSGEVILTLGVEKQKAVGLQVAELSAASVRPEVKGYGRVLDASPLAALVSQSGAAQASALASEAEVRRLKALAAQDNASARALQAAEAAAARDRAQADLVRQRLLADWGAAIAGRADLAAFAQSLVVLQSAIVRVDLPAGESLSSAPAGARLAAVAEETQPVDAGFVGAAPAVDPQTQGQAFFFLLKPRPWSFAPGAAVIGYLDTGGEPLRGVIAPESSIIRYQGQAWVYVEKDGRTFHRRPVVLNRPVDSGWLITEGLKPGEHIVVREAQALLSEELKNQMGIRD